MNSSQGSGTLYNTTPIYGLKSIYFKIAQGNKTYTVTTGTSQNPTTNSKTGTTSNSFSVISGDTYFQLKVSGGTFFSYIEITYDDSVIPLETVSTPTFSPAGGTYNAAQDVTINCDTDGATIHYTTDGTDPTTSSPVYSSAIHVDETMTIKAIAVKDGMNNSEIASATYTIDIPPVGTTSATFDATIDKGSSPLTKGYVSFACSNGVLNNGSEYRLYANSTTTFSVPNGYKIVKIVFTGVKGNPISNFSPTDGLNYSGNDGVWQGNAQSVSFTASSQVRATLIQVYYTEPEKLYILGQVNGNDATQWDMSKGVEMAKIDGQYTATVYFTGSNTEVKNINGSDVTQQVSYFSFAKVLNPTDDQRIGAGSDSDYWLTDETTITQSTGHNLWNPGQTAFRIIPGVYKFTVNLDNSKLYIERKDVNITFSPESGAEVETGSTVQLSSNLSELIGSAATLQYNTDGGNAYTSGNTVTLGDNEGTQDVHARATVTGSTGYVATFASATANYTTYKTYAVNIAELTNGTITANPTKARAGQTVTLTISADSGAQLSDGPTVTGVEDITNNGDGTYTFTMPANDVTVNATFAKIDYAITVSYPNGNHGTVTDLPQTAQSGNPISFTVTPNNKYEVVGVTATFVNNNGGTTQVNGFSQDGNTYSFNMPAYPVNIAITYSRISTSNVYELVTDASTLKAGDKIIFTNGASGYVYAMGEQKANNFAATTNWSLVSDNQVEAPEGTQVITLEGETGAWYFNVGSKYLTSNSSSSNYLRTTTDKNDNAKATISITNNAALITFQGSYMRRYIRYNTDGWFACYGRSTDLNPVYIFRQTATGLQVDITPESGEVIGATQVTIEANDDQAKVSYKIGDSGQVVTTDNYTTNVTITGAVGETVTVYGYASKDDEGETLTDEASATYTFVAPDAPSITPATCHITDIKQSVSITSSYADGMIEYSTDGGATWETYSGKFDVEVEAFGQSATIQARVTVNGVTSDVASATYTRDIQPVVFSPASGTYRGDQTCQMFSITKGARIYYTTDGSDPVMNQGTTKLYTGEIAMPATGTYTFKAVAYIGTTASTVTSAEYTIQNKYTSGNYLYSVKELNEHAESNTDWTMANPVQVIYMSTFQQNGYQPEFCLVRDNTGYGMIYFGKQNTYHNNYHVFSMGDWIDGGYYGPISYAKSQKDGLLDTHPELGDNNRGSVRIHNWYSSLKMDNSPVLPEYIDIPSILASETAGNTDYWGHYVHLRKNTIELTAIDEDGKWSGRITAENGEDMILYYDKFYLQYGKDWTTTDNDFIGHPNRTFDIYGFVACHLLSETHYQIAPFAFAWIDQPTCSHATGEYTSAQQVTLASDEDPEATIWYKTSDMDDYAIYHRGTTIAVNSTTTIEWYATKMSDFNDELESKRGSVTLNFVEIAKPVITPESVVKTVGESVDATIAYEEGKTVPADAVIIYTTDGTDPKTSETVQTYVAGETELHFTTTTTVRAITQAGDLYSAEAEPRTYSFVKSNGVVYDLVTDVNQLTENGVYLIVSQNYGESLSTMQNTANRGAAGVMFVENSNKAKVYGNSDVALFQLTSLTHGEDQGSERHFLFHTGNGTDEVANGYLYVGHENDNTLLTEAEEDQLGNSVMVVTIDDDGRAHLRMNYSGGSNRYIQYWNRDRYFTTYKTEDDDRAVYIYGTTATPLAVIEQSGTQGKSYTVADDLQVVWVNTSKSLAWARDLDDNIDAVTIPNMGDNEYDYLRNAGQQTGAWQQNNWVMLDFSGADHDEFGKLGAVIASDSPKHLIIKGGTLSGVYSDNRNYTITVSGDAVLSVEEPEANYVPNVYCAANYGADAEGWQQEMAGGMGRSYWFMTPKVMEVATHTWSVWNGDGFYVAARDMATHSNEAGLVGAFSADWSYNAGQFAPTTGEAYKFLGVVMLKDEPQQSAGQPRHVAVQDGSTPNTKYVVGPLDLTGSKEQIVTAVSQLTAGREVVSVTYCDVAGRMSAKPFEGVNIVVTRYSDGTVTTGKAVF